MKQKPLAAVKRQMKPIFILVVLAHFAIVAFTQNTFPSSGIVTIGTTGSGFSNPRLLIAADPNSVNIPLQVAGDNGGRVFRFYTNDYNNTSTGTSLRLNFGASSGNTFSAFQSYTAGETAQGNIILNGSGGNTGIGTYNPTAKLEINGGKIKVLSGTDNKILTGYNSSGGDATIYLTGDATTANWRFDTYSTAGSLFIQNDGNVGIGTTSPSDRLTINGNMAVRGNDKGINIYKADGTQVATLSDYNGSNADEGILALFKANTIKVHISANRDSYFNGGNVGIGTTAPTEKLSVNGNVSAKKLIVTNTGWSDYVFKPSFRLRPIAEISAFIAMNKHLPEVPTEADIKKNGVDVGDNIALLLKKIEELTLYVIDLKKQNDLQDSQIRKLKKQIRHL